MSNQKSLPNQSQLQTQPYSQAMPHGENIQAQITQQSNTATETMPHSNISAPTAECMDVPSHPKESQPGSIDDNQGTTNSKLTAATIPKSDSDTQPLAGGLVEHQSDASPQTDIAPQSEGKLDAQMIVDPTTNPGLVTNT